mgnify:CR=1 FL=1
MNSISKRTFWINRNLKEYGSHCKQCKHDFWNIFLLLFKIKSILEGYKLLLELFFVVFAFLAQKIIVASSPFINPLNIIKIQSSLLLHTMLANNFMISTRQSRSTIWTSRISSAPINNTLQMKRKFCLVLNRTNSIIQPNNINSDIRLNINVFQ